jgi:cholinesterase
MRKLIAWFLLLPALGFGAVALAQPPLKQPFSAMWVFGGPLEDVGNFASVNGGTLPPPFFNNTLSNGPLAVQFLADYLGFKLTPSLHRVGPPMGNDFASADALANGPDPKDLQGQLNAYFQLSHGTADPNAFYYMIIGGNEVIEATESTDDVKSFQILKGAVDSKKLAIHRLVGAGAKTFFIDNFFNLGRTPRMIKLGLTARATQMSQLHNHLMNEMLAQAQRDLDFNLIYFDVFQFGEDAIAGSGRNRFTNITGDCVDVLNAGGTCNPDNFIFFTDITVTTRLGQLWGHQLINLLEHNNFEVACREAAHIHWIPGFGIPPAPASCKVAPGFGP